MKTLLLILLSIVFGMPAQAAPTAAELLATIDKNMTFESRKTTVTMTVTKNGRVKTYQMESFGRGADEGAVEFLAPARDKDTRMLKKGGELWMFLPHVEKVQKISGHMLRQGLMGSDFSYEDMLETAALSGRYDAKVLGEEVKDGRKTWKLEMTAKSADVSYPKRVSWIDQEYGVPVREELYAVSGMLLKVFTFSEVKDFDGRRFPTVFKAEDQVQQGSVTELRFDSLEFKVAVPDEVFNLRWLER